MEVESSSTPLPEGFVAPPNIPSGWEGALHLALTMDPQELASLYVREAHAASRMNSLRRDLIDAGLGEQEKQEKMALYERDPHLGSELADMLCGVISSVAAYDSPRLGAILTSLAENPDSEGRELAGTLIGSLPPLDHDLGVRLWDQLLRDEDDKVREIAYDSLMDALDVSDLSRADEAIAEIGLTWRDAYYLLCAHVGHGDFLSHRLGGATLGQTVERPDEQA